MEVPDPYENVGEGWGEGWGARGDGPAGADFKATSRRLKERAGGEAAHNSETRKVFCDCLFLRLRSPSFTSLAPSADAPADLTSFHPPAAVPGSQGTHSAPVGGASTRLSAACVTLPLISSRGGRSAKQLARCLPRASPDARLILQQYG